MEAGPSNIQFVHPTEEDAGHEISKNLTGSGLHGSTSHDTEIVVDTCNISPEMVRPFPKAGPRKHSHVNNRKRKSEVLTDTPIRNELAKMKTEMAMKKGDRKDSFRCAEDTFQNPCRPALKMLRKTKQNKLVNTTDSGTDGEETLSLLCFGPYSKSWSNEQWV
ncbi:hypothetical protein PR048_016010 [Dryococelus australis]|uniref:Uncharacterized protein n=1 Tax=Dryococelus australis TaxID=614101 RepID=A0ABQ9HJP0_9NEOP|nr:hypothetical protein PR048_016010 [Dryococelus australis]